MAQTIIVDTTPGYRMPTIYYSQGDIGRTFSIDLQSRFGESLPASPTITIQATKPSGLGFSVASTSISGAVVTFTVTETMSNEAGRFPAELKIVKNSETLFTANFYIDCEANAHPEGTTDGDIEHIMPKFMSVTATTLPAGDSATYTFDPVTNTANFGIPKGADGSLASQVLAADYSSSKIYAIGDYVYYNGNLYRCTTAITTAEAWTSGHWTQVALGDDVSDLKSDLNEICDSITNDLIASAYRKDGCYVDWSNGEEYVYEPFCDYRIYVTEAMIGKHYMLKGTALAQVAFFNSNEIGTSHYISGVNYARDFVIPQNTKLITISLDKTATIACTPYLFPISSPVVNSDVELSNNEDYKAVESYVTIDTNDLRYKAQMVEGAYVSYGNGVIYYDTGYRYYVISCTSDMIGKVFNTTVGQNVAFFDSNKIHISGVDTNNTTPQFTFTVPSDTEYIVVSSGNSTDSPVIPNGETYRFNKVLADDINIPTDDTNVTIDTNDLRHEAQVVEGAYVNYGDGSIGYDGNYRYYKIPCTSDMIGKVYNTTLGHQVTFFTSNNSYLSGVDTNHTTPLFTFTVPSNTGYITVSSHVDSDTPVVPNGESYHYSKYLTDDILLGEYIGMKYCAIGDSITSGDLAELPSTGFKTPYHLVASNMLGLIDINKGVSGSRMAVTDEPDVPTPIVTRVLQLDGTEGYDFITVMGGTNDSLNSVPVGTINDVVQTTFAGAINVICQHLKSIYPIGRIGFITPLRYTNNDSVELPYVEMMQAVCAKWGIPVYDAFHDSGISVLNISNGELVYDWQSFGYYGDELHPNWKGHEMFGRKVAEYLKTL